MNELQVVVNQTPGTVTWNFEDLKKAITEALESYKTTVYDDSNIQSAKKDRTMLNKLSKSVDDRKKEIKKKCLEPYEIIDKQAKELIAIINEPISVIDERLEEYEKARRKKARLIIEEYMNKAFEGIEQCIADKARKGLYDTRWENASAKKSEWISAIDSRVEIVKSDLQILDGIEEEFRTHAMDSYKVNLRLSDAMSKVQELRVQKAEILKRQQEEAERKRQEEERRREEAALAAESLESPQSEMGRVIDSIERGAYASVTGTIPIAPHNVTIDPAKSQGKEHQEPVTKPSQTIRITGTHEEYQKVVEYIKAMGISYEEV